MRVLNVYRRSVDSENRYRQRSGGMRFLNCKNVYAISHGLLKRQWIRESSARSEREVEEGRALRFLRVSTV